MNEASIPTRYPETLELLKRDYTQGVVKDILFKSKEVLEWKKISDIFLTSISAVNKTSKFCESS